MLEVRNITGKHSGIATDPFIEGADELLFDRDFASERVTSSPEGTVEQMAGSSRKKLLLGREVEVQPLPRDVCRPGNLVHGCLAESVPQKRRHCGFEQALPLGISGGHYFCDLIH